MFSTRLKSIVHYLSFQNKVVDLREGELHASPHSRRDRESSQNVSLFEMNENTPALSLRGSEATKQSHESSRNTFPNWANVRRTSALSFQRRLVIGFATVHLRWTASSAIKTSNQVIFPNAFNSQQMKPIEQIKENPIRTNLSGQAGQATQTAVLSLSEDGTHPSPHSRLDRESSLKVPPIGIRDNIPTLSMRINAVFFIVLISLILLGASAVFAQDITLVAEIDPSVCAVNERVTYTVTISGSKSLPDLISPDFDGFDIISGPNSSSSVQIINTKVSRTKSISYILRPRKEGEFSFPPAVAIEKKKEYKSNPVQLTVNAAGSSPLSQPRVGLSNSRSSQKSNSNQALPDVFINARVDKDTVYTQEMALVEYDLYFKVQVGNYGFPKLPSATGFWREEIKMTANPSVRNVEVKGVQYKVATIRREAYFPTRTGTLQIEPASVDVNVEVRSNSRRRSIWDDPFFSRSRTEVRTLNAPPIDLTVLPLPDTGKPYNFKGDVGDFDLSVSADKNEVDQHEAINIKVRVNGIGYIKSVDPPKLNLPDGFESFDPTISENINLYSSGMRGSKTYNYLVIPRVAGEFNIKPLQFSYFNPETGKYETAKSRSLKIVVNPGAGDAASDGSYFNQERVSLLGQDIRFIKEISAPLTTVKTQVYNSAQFYVGLLLFPFLFLIGLGLEAYYNKRNADPKATRLRRAPENFRKAVKQSGQLLKTGKSHEAISSAAGAFAEVIGAIIDHPAAGLTSAIIEKGLRELKADDAFIAEIKTIVAKSDFYRFGVGEVDAGEAEALIASMEKVLVALERLK